MVLREFLLLALAHWLALVSPGPDFFLLLRNALRHGRLNGIGTSFGIACANGIYIVLALTGFSVLQHRPSLLMIMKLLASAYLALIGWTSLRSGSRHPLAVPPTPSGADQRQHGSDVGFWAGCLSGLLSAGLNPKNALFYLGLFTLMVDVTTVMSIKALYGFWMFFLVFFWDAALVLLVSQAQGATRRVPHLAPHLTRYLAHAEWLAGALLLVAALMMAISTAMSIGQ